MIDRVAAEISVVLIVAIVALVSIPVPRHKPPVPVEVPAAPVPVPVEMPAVPEPGSASLPAKSEEGEMPLQVERPDKHVSIQQLLVKMNRIESKLNEVQEDERAGQQHTN